MSNEVVDFAIFMIILAFFGHVWKKWKESFTLLQIRVFMGQFKQNSSNYFFDRNYSSLMIGIVEFFVEILFVLAALIELLIFLAILILVLYLFFGYEIFLIR